MKLCMTRTFYRLGLALAIGALVLQPAGALAKSRASRADKPVSSGGGANGLQFRLAFDKTTYAPNDPVLVRFTLKNTGAKPVWVTKRFYLSAQSVVPQHRDVFLEVTAPSGQSLPSTYTHQAGFPKCDVFEQLDPGEEVTAEGQQNLRYYFELKEPGAYQVVGVYENVFGPEIGLETFQGTVRSEPVTFTVTE